MRALLLGWSARGAGLALGALAVWALANLAFQASDVLLLAFIAILLAAGLEPFVGGLRSRLPLGRIGTILLVYAAFFTLVVLLVLLVLPTAITQAEQVVDRLPAFLDRFRTWGAQVGPEPVAIAVQRLADAAQQQLAPAPPPDAEDVVRVGLTLAEVLGAVATVLALVFFWLIGHARLQRYVLAFLPAARRREVRDTWNEVESRLGLWVRGQLILMVVVGLVSGAAYALLGVPAALLFALVAGLAEAIPLVGPIVGAVPAVIAAGTRSFELAVMTAGAAALIQLLENHLLVPHVMRNTIGLSPLVVTVSLLVGAAVGGVPGALVAVPLVAGAEVIAGRLQDREVPVAQEPAAAEQPDEAEREALSRSLPDAAKGPSPT